MIRDRALLALAVSSGLATPEEIALYHRPPEPDPLADLTPAERIAYAIDHAASGAAADLPVIDVVVAPDGRHLPHPHPAEAQPDSRSVGQ